LRDRFASSSSRICRRISAEMTSGGRAGGGSSSADDAVDLDESTPDPEETDDTSDPTSSSSSPDPELDPNAAGSDATATSTAARTFRAASRLPLRGLTFPSASSRRRVASGERGVDGGSRTEERRGSARTLRLRPWLLMVLGFGGIRGAVSCRLLVDCPNRSSRRTAVVVPILAVGVPIRVDD
jgi:hypothetical protein